MNAEMMSTREVAAYLRIKERKVYELVRTRAIPCTRVTGKWLFPRVEIDQWIASNMVGRREGEEARPERFLVHAALATERHEVPSDVFGLLDRLGLAERFEEDQRLEAGEDRPHGREERRHRRS